MIAHKNKAVELYCPLTLGTNPTACLGEKCMAWKWVLRAVPPEYPGKYFPSVPVIERTDIGYCGMTSK